MAQKIISGVIRKEEVIEMTDGSGLEEEIAPSVLASSSLDKIDGDSEDDSDTEEYGVGLHPSLSMVMSQDGIEQMGSVSSMETEPSPKSRPPKRLRFTGFFEDKSPRSMDSPREAITRSYSMGKFLGKEPGLLTDRSVEPPSSFPVRQSQSAPSLSSLVPDSLELSEVPDRHMESDDEAPPQAPKEAMATLQRTLFANGALDGVSFFGLVSKLEDPKIVSAANQVLSWVKEVASQADVVLDDLPVKAYLMTVMIKAYPRELLFLDNKYTQDLRGTSQSLQLNLNIIQSMLLAMPDTAWPLSNEKAQQLQPVLYLIQSQTKLYMTQLKCCQVQDLLAKQLLAFEQERLTIKDHPASLLGAFKDRYDAAIKELESEFISTLGPEGLDDIATIRAQQQEEWQWKKWRFMPDDIYSHQVGINPEKLISEMMRDRQQWYPTLIQSLFDHPDRFYTRLYDVIQDITRSLMILVPAKKEMMIDAILSDDQIQSLLGDAERPVVEVLSLMMKRLFFGIKVLTDVSFHSEIYQCENRLKQRLDDGEDWHTVLKDGLSFVTHSLVSYESELCAHLLQFCRPAMVNAAISSEKKLFEKRLLRMMSSLNTVKEKVLAAYESPSSASLTWSQLFSESAPRHLIAYLLLDTLGQKAPLSATTCPETFGLDLAELQTQQQTLAHFAKLGTAVTVFNEYLSPDQSIRDEELSPLKRLISDEQDDTQLLIDQMLQLLDTRFDVDENALKMKKKSQIETHLSRVLNQESGIYLAIKRVFLRQLRAKIYTPIGTKIEIKSASLQPFLADIQQMGQRLAEIAQFNFKVYGDYYQQLNTIMKENLLSPFFQPQLFRISTAKNTLLAPLYADVYMARLQHSRWSYAMSMLSLVHQQLSTETRLMTGSGITESLVSWMNSQVESVLPSSQIAVDMDLSVMVDDWIKQVITYDAIQAEDRSALLALMAKLRPLSKTDAQASSQALSQLSQPDLMGDNDEMNQVLKRIVSRLGESCEIADVGKLVMGLCQHESVVVRHFGRLLDQRVQSAQLSADQEKMNGSMQDFLSQHSRRIQKIGLINEAQNCFYIEILRQSRSQGVTSKQLQTFLVEQNLIEWSTKGPVSRQEITDKLCQLVQIFSEEVQPLAQLDEIQTSIRESLDMMNKVDILVHALDQLRRLLQHYWPRIKGRAQVSDQTGAITRARFLNEVDQRIGLMDLVEWVQAPDIQYHEIPRKIMIGLKDMFTLKDRDVLFHVISGDIQSEVESDFNLDQDLRDSVKDSLFRQLNAAQERVHPGYRVYLAQLKEALLHRSNDLGQAGLLKFFEAQIRREHAGIQAIQTRLIASVPQDAAPVAAQFPAHIKSGR